MTSSSFPCIWEANTNAIIVLEMFKIDSPYDTVVPLKGAPEDKAGLERVIKVVRARNAFRASSTRSRLTSPLCPFPSLQLEGERKKLKL